MKTFVWFVCVLVILAKANALDKATTKVKNVHEACQADPGTHADEYLIERARMEQVDPKKVGLHTLCMNVHAGLQKENGDIDKDDLRRALSEGIHDSAKVEAIVADCGVRVGDTPEEASVNLFRCIFGHENAYVHEWKPPMIHS
ncbi:B2 protein [Leptinotarsa decemlineata]|uniref:B2 protein n=1 Tax=Leptinotarsa decemlineata TaxID=7539 RepID=UPI003D30D339